MAKCDEGYLCVVCGEEVKRLDQSELYLKFVLGLVNTQRLNQLPERHLKCSPATSQFILDEQFEGTLAEGLASKKELDPTFRSDKEKLYTKGFHRLQFLQKNRRGMSIDQYPIAEEEP